MPKKLQCSSLPQSMTLFCLTYHPPSWSGAKPWTDRPEPVAGSFECALWEYYPAPWQALPMAQGFAIMASWLAVPWASAESPAPGFPRGRSLEAALASTPETSLFFICKISHHLTFRGPLANGKGYDNKRWTGIFEVMLKPLFKYRF